MAAIVINLTPEQVLSLSRNENVVITIGGESEQPADADRLQTQSFFSFFEEQIRLKAGKGSERTSEIYDIVLKKFRLFRNGEDLAPSAVTAKLMDEYELYLKEGGLSMNTISFHMRALRAVYNRTVREGMTVDRSPFRRVYTGVAKTEKRAITPQDIHALLVLKLEEGSPEAFARDMFMFSFYTRGMALVDVAFLKTSDIKNGVLTYVRHKTRQTINVRWEMEMQEIVDRYHSPGQPYLLPVIRKLNGKERTQLRYRQGDINRALHRLGRKIGLQSSLTFYVARHSWASIARQLGVSTALISLGMGHASEYTTQVYLKSMESHPLDEANRLIIDTMK